ncbi:MAG: DMT family transporter [Caulobacteraceae bacterium]
MATADETESPHPSLAERFYSHPYLLLALATLGFGGNAVAGRAAVAQISPMLLTASRWGIVMAVMLVACRGPIAQTLPTLRRQWKSLLVMGAVGFTAFNALNYVAAHHTTAVNISIIQGAIPALVLLGGLVAHRAPVRLGQAGGVALAMVGVAVVASNGSLASLLKLQFNIGDLMMLGACVLYSGYAVALRSRGPGSGSALGFFFGLAAAAFVSSLPLLAVEVASGGLLPPTPKGWVVLIYAALAPSFICQVFFIRAVALIGPARAGLFINLVPVWGALLAVLILGERFGLHHAAGLALVLIGIVLSERAVKR